MPRSRLDFCMAQRRLLGVQLQADSSEPGRDGSRQSPGLILSVTVGDAVIA